MDWNEVLNTGDVANGEVNVVIEIPRGSNSKVEWKRKLKVMTVDRVEPKIFAKPTNYGFIPQTLDEDGDELDALVITDADLPTGVFVKSKVVGVMKFLDNGEVDDKVLCVPDEDRQSGNRIATLSDLPEQLLKQIEFHFTHYKDLKKPGSTGGVEFYDRNEAKKVIVAAQKRWEDQ